MNVHPASQETLALAGEECGMRYAGFRHLKRKDASAKRSGAGPISTTGLPVGLHH